LVLGTHLPDDRRGVDQTTAPIPNEIIGATEGGQRSDDPRRAPPRSPNHASAEQTQWEHIRQQAPNGTHDAASANLGQSNVAQKPNKKLKGSIKIATLNIRGGGSASREKWNSVNQIMRDQKIAILAVQETHLTNDQLADLNRLFERQLIFYNTADNENTNSKGVAIVINKRLLAWREVRFEEMIPGRALAP